MVQAAVLPLASKLNKRGSQKGPFFSLQERRKQQMTWSINSKCHECKHGAFAGEGNCKDQNYIQNGIQACYINFENHKGSGTVELQCNTFEKAGE